MNKRERALSIVGASGGGRPIHDFYPTPLGATIALLQVEQFPKTIWEPACGDGAICKVLQARGHDVIASDLIDRGYGEGNIDFLQTTTKRANALITNPPFRLAEDFLAHALNLGIEKIGLLAKLAFLEGQKRSALLQSSPLARVWVFSNRLKLTRRGASYKNSGMIAFAWFVWEKHYIGAPQLGWITSQT